MVTEEGSQSENQKPKTGTMDDVEEERGRKDKNTSLLDQAVTGKADTLAVGTESTKVQGFQETNQTNETKSRIIPVEVKSRGKRLLWGPKRFSKSSPTIMRKKTTQRVQLNQIKSRMS